MNQQRIPGTDLDVSAICLGTMTFGNPVDKDDAIQIVQWALAEGINFIDTADIYEGYDRKLGSPGGVAESILGEALCDRRDRAVVTTKVGNDVGVGKGLGRDHIQRQINASLRRLRTDYVDIYELHRPDPDTPLEESVAVMAELIAAGKVRHWGFSNFDGEQIHQMLAICERNHWPKPVVSQPHYSWLTRDIESSHLPVCRQARIAVTPYRCLEGGLLTGKYRRGHAIPAGSRITESAWLREPDDALYDRIEKFVADASKRSMTPARYAIEWSLEQPAVVSVVIGTKSISQLKSLL